MTIERRGKISGIQPPQIEVIKIPEVVRQEEQMMQPREYYSRLARIGVLGTPIWMNAAAYLTAYSNRSGEYVGPIPEVALAAGVISVVGAAFGFAMDRSMMRDPSIRKPGPTSQ